MEHLKKLFIVLFLSPIISVSAQSNGDEIILVKESNYIISYTKGECAVVEGLKPFEYGFLKVENLTNKELKLGFNVVLQFDGGCDGCNGTDESRFYIDLKPNQKYHATCASENRSLFLIRNPNFDGSWNFEEARIDAIDVIK